MHVIATAGHVDHGKSTLVRALTGIEPDRWAEEHRRGLTIDLGYAWTTLPSGEQVAFVDVPGHERFIGNMLAGLGPAPAVLLVVAADEGWRQQTTEHLAAVDALGVTHGLVVVTRRDLADPAPALADALARVARSSLAGSEAVVVSARTGEGLADLRAAIDSLVGALDPPAADGRLRLWIDRSFTIRGAGTVVTGTLGEGTIRAGDELVLHDAAGRSRHVTVRGLQSLERSHDVVPAVARVAVNLRGVPAEEVRRGDLLLAPGAWPTTAQLDVRLTGEVPDRLSAHLMVHVGTHAAEARVRPLGGPAARLTLPSLLPLVAGDRLILRDPGSRQLHGALVVDADPPRLQRRGAAAARADVVARQGSRPDLGQEVGRRGAMTVEAALALGNRVPGGSRPAASVARHGQWLVSDAAWREWADRLRAAVQRKAAGDPLDPTLTLEAGRAAAGAPDRALLADLTAYAGLAVRDGRVGLPGHWEALPEQVQAALRTLEARLGDEPFAAPEQRELQALGLGPREVAAAVRAGRLVRLDDDVVLLPTGPARAMRVLAGLPQPFTTSEARVALASTRRTVIPLLEHLDGRGWTRRLDGSHREVRRPDRPAPS
ncbi:translation elongation factor [Terrabacter sp. Soil811]|uniref:selenocysteine-specific translation elongation factor n=1 Tax=Terrabacter sp. Soil811 TaxID=1736419 RepID=UPI0006FB5DF9|nr:selenocysteine-specific translation elongation factor [Terrabacter sp. Soil811]KRF44334.1 translation elongation factor [Terrabacter sp. Soil811]